MRVARVCLVIAPCESGEEADAGEAMRAPRWARAAMTGLRRPTMHVKR